MGLLTRDNKNSENKLLKFLNCHSGKLSFTCFLSAFTICIVLLLDQFTDRTYFSDNALLPGLVHREFSHSNQIDNILDELKTYENLNEFPSSSFVDFFVKFGLEAYEQHFTLNYPFGKQPKLNGCNVYAIMRAPRAPSTEAIVLAAPYRGNSHPSGNSFSTLALLLQLANYVNTKNYWAKDIIFLFYEHELVGAQAWLNAYYGNHNQTSDESSLLECDDLIARAGVIQGAVNLDLPSKPFSRLDVRIEGFNGQLPNLDLFNVAVELATRESVTPTFHGKSHLFTSDSKILWKEYIRTIGSMMITQASSFPTGAHAVFQKFAIQAITLAGMEDDENEPAYLHVTLVQVGRILEGILRSLNNLLERFNRSFWFYLLPSTRRYISIGTYMIPFSIFLLPLLIQAVELHYSKKDDNLTSNLWPAASGTIFAYLFGIALSSFPFLLQKFAHIQMHFLWNTQETLFYTLSTFIVCLMINPVVEFKSSDNLDASKIVILLNTALVFGALSLLNFSLSFALIIFYAPITCLICTNFQKPFLNRIKSAFTRILLLLLNPLTIVFICSLVISLLHEPNKELLEHLKHSLTETQKLILFLVEDWYFYGNWTFIFGTAVLFPLWLQLWHQ